MQQHRSGKYQSFTKRYNGHKLVYFEKTQYVNNAIKREKQIKKWRRQWKENLINDFNPDWKEMQWMLGD